MSAIEGDTCEEGGSWSESVDVWMACRRGEEYWWLSRTVMKPEGVCWVELKNIDLHTPDDCKTGVINYSVNTTLGGFALLLDGKIIFLLAFDLELFCGSYCFFSVLFREQHRS